MAPGDVIDKDGSSPRVRGTRVETPARESGQRFIPACAGNASVADRSATLMAVHPRVCGERQVTRATPVEYAGSSPRVRGTHSACSAPSSISRFIPACAGNASETPGQGAHVSGSSPRVRGTRLELGAALGNERFIPACAGNARCGRCSLAPRTVHPRVCGERGATGIRPIVVGGSSPRVRGTQDESTHPFSICRFIPACAGNADAALHHEASGRFIPACAGNARCSDPLRRRMTVHPRVCGERSTVPKMRGPRMRFIPACAGNAAAWAMLSAGIAVHPRVCGERYICELDSEGFAGSSPRVRGTHRDQGRDSVYERFIPACAGNASRARGQQPMRSVHPRVCGERLAQVFGLPVRSGSSPRVRGTPQSSMLALDSLRFIPACAGNASV